MENESTEGRKKMFVDITRNDSCITRPQASGGEKMLLSEADKSINELTEVLTNETLKNRSIHQHCFIIKHLEI